MTNLAPPSPCLPANLFGAITACVFDAYGTLFDAGSLLPRMGSRLGEKGADLVRIWRQRQLEYSWQSSLMNRYCDFWRITEKALDYALALLKFPEDKSLRQNLLDAFLTLDVFPDVFQTLRPLRKNGFQTAILSNGTPGMLQTASDAAGITPLIHLFLSVQATGCYKPDPSVYRHAVQRLDVPWERVLFISANGWDVAGAAAYGLQTIWINRHGLPFENLNAPPTLTLPRLRDLVDYLCPSSLEELPGEGLAGAIFYDPNIARQTVSASRLSG